MPEVITGFYDLGNYILFVTIYFFAQKTLDMNFLVYYKDGHNEMQYQNKFWTDVSIQN